MENSSCYTAIHLLCLAQERNQIRNKILTQNSIQIFSPSMNFSVGYDLRHRPSTNNSQKKPADLSHNRKNLKSTNLN